MTQRHINDQHYQPLYTIDIRMKSFISNQVSCCKCRRQVGISGQKSIETMFFSAMLPKEHLNASLQQYCQFSHSLCETYPFSQANFGHDLLFLHLIFGLLPNLSHLSLENLTENSMLNPPSVRMVRAPKYRMSGSYHWICKSVQCYQYYNNNFSNSRLKSRTEGTSCLMQETYLGIEHLAVNFSTRDYPHRCRV